MSKASEWADEMNRRYAQTQPEFKGCDFSVYVDSLGRLVLNGGVVEPKKVPELLKWIKETFE